MSENMKRKQFHLSLAEEKMLYEIASKHNISEAEVVRTAIRELAKSELDRNNSLLEMARTARVERGNHGRAPANLSENHDEYLAEAYEDKT